MSNKLPVDYLEFVENKVTTIDSSATDEQYPSAKAVYDSLQNAGGGGNITVDQTYDRFSENPQSGIAVSELFDSLNASNAPGTHSIRTRGGDNDVESQFTTALGAQNKVIIDPNAETEDQKGSNYSLMAGYQNKLTSKGGKDMLLGLRNISNSTCTFAANRYNTVGNVSSFALGERNVSNHQAAGTLGCRLSTSAPNQVVVGSLNAPNENALFIVGGGKYDQSNAFTVQKGGTITVGGHFETSVLSTNDLTQRDNFNDFENGHNVGATKYTASGYEDGNYIAAISTGWTNDGHNSVEVSSSNCSLTDLPLTISLPTITVREGETYRLSMNVVSITSGVDKIKYYIGRAAKPYYVWTKEEVKTGLTNSKFKTISSDFTADFTGTLHIGVTYPDNSDTTFKYFIANIILEKIDTQYAKYDFVSKDKTKTQRLYKIADIPSTDFWYTMHNGSRIIYTHKYGEVKTSNSNVYADDARDNTVLRYNDNGKDIVLACLVDSIDPTKMEVNEPGLYVHPTVTGISWDSWVDNEFDIQQMHSDIEQLKNTPSTSTELPETLEFIKRDDETLFQDISGGSIVITAARGVKLTADCNGSILYNNDSLRPTINNYVSLGTNSYKYENVYTNKLTLSKESYGTSLPDTGEEGQLFIVI